MINNVPSTGVRAADLAALGQNRAKKAEPAEDTTAEASKPSKPTHPVHPKGHIPPGLARAAENIASKMFARADADASGTVTQEELSALHSKHARVLAASELFQAATEVAPSAPVDASAESTEPATNATVDAANATLTEATETPAVEPAPAGVTEAQLKAALAKFFYAKVGITWTPPAPSAVEEPVAPIPAIPTTPSEVEAVAEETNSDPGFTAVA